ncbi:oocyte zinc finger protein XlCOF6.1-like [Sebastes umbrosus]|uniref:oocyte zinc finger protein XlCOF6.1-like n=1 Tax=Sebastes umbrosus TaxID=72105 RepID=UPI00189FA7F4|nr:oocyte zinc finger protein XlCOF6.1-like [Sebastes umbrosus]XP_037646487.1 oocyte zinc finger protein XlCOF6.1-like [Sebastes umbrosus]
MLDKSSDKDQQTAHCCSDCGCILPQPDSDSAPPKQQRVHKAAGPSKCPSCQAGTSSLSNGRRHRPHRRIRLDPHSCSLCSKTFISSAHLTLHLASHNKERKFRCSTCGKYFHQSSHLMAHKLIHSGDRPFKCPECGKTFGRASHLKTHRRLHTGEKPFKCTFCDKSFTQKAGLLAHVRLHTGERSYRCEQCGEGFRSLSLLLSHKADEASGHAKPEPAPPAPNQPQKTQSSPEDLNCGVCCRTFVRSSYIRLHIRLNKGQRPYHCKVCNKTFVKLDTFVNHCDKHLRQKRDKSVAKEVKDKVVKPPQFVPLSKLPPPPPPPESSPTQPLSSEVNTRSRAKAKIKTEP